MIYGYARVSTKGQAKDGNSLEAQKKKLKEAGAEKIYLDKYTGTKIDRPQFKILRGKLKAGDTLMVTKLDRFARSLSQACDLIEELIKNGITIYVLNWCKLDNSSLNKAMRDMLLVFAELERNMIVERTQEGKSIARKNNPNFREGRPRALTEKQREHALKLLETNTYSEVADILKVSKSTLIRIKRAEVQKEIIKENKGE